MPRERAEAEVRRMLATLRHESFYLTGTWSDEASGVYLGWCARPSAIADGKPMCDERNGVVIALSGEEFSGPSAAPRDADGRPVRPEETCRAYLLTRYRQDPAFPKSLNGRFHGLVVDKKRRVTTLFNDRYGMQRLYYHESSEAFYFAAEAKAILAVRPTTRSIEPAAMAEFVSCGCVLSDKTLFKGVHVLPAGSAWAFGDGPDVEKRKYFEAREWEEQSLLDDETYYESIRDVFQRQLPRYFNSADPLALSLTGGLDTRMIMAWQQAREGTLPCYTFVGPYRECYDVTVGRRVAQQCRQPFEVISVGDDFLTRFARYAERTVYLSDGCADVSRSADLYVNEQARSIAPVRMTGNYGGEVLRRVRAFKPIDPMRGLFRPEFQSHLHQARQTYGSLLQQHPLSFAVFTQAPWHHYGLSALEQTQVAVRSPYLDNEFVRTVFRAPASACRSDAVCLRLIEDGNPVLRRILTDRGAGGSGVRASAWRAWLEFQFKAEYAYDYGMPQWVAQADHAAASLRLERLFLGRHKFYHYRIWYRDAVASYLRDVLLDRQALSRPYLESATVERIVRGHLRGHRNYTTAIHKVLTLELVHRQLIDAA